MLPKADLFFVFEKVKISEQDGNYTMDHTAGTYISDKQGRPRLYMSYGQDHQKFLHDLELLLSRD